MKKAFFFPAVQHMSMSATELAEKLAPEQFTPCQSTQSIAAGWMNPRPDEGPLIEALPNGQLIGRFAIETKSVPALAIKKWVNDKAQAIENESGRKVGRRERKDIKDDAQLALLPQAFPRRTELAVLFDLELQLLIVEAGTIGQCDQVLTSLSRTCGHHFKLLDTNTSLRDVLTDWLRDDENVPAEWAVGTSGTLTSSDGREGEVRVKKHMRDAEIRAQVAEGWVPIELELTYCDRLTITLTEKGQLKGIRYASELGLGKTGRKADDFDADWQIVGAELQGMLQDLIQTRLAGLKKDLTDF